MYEKVLYLSAAVKLHNCDVLVFFYISIWLFEPNTLHILNMSGSKRKPLAIYSIILLDFMSSRLVECDE